MMVPFPEPISAVRGVAKGGQGFSHRYVPFAQRSTQTTPVLALSPRIPFSRFIEDQLLISRWDPNAKTRKGSM